MSRSSLSLVLLGVLYADAAAIALPLVAGTVESYRIELGASDDAFLLGDPSSWGRAYQDSGPFRLRRGERRMTYFAARMAFPRAGIRVPARVAPSSRRC